MKKMGRDNKDASVKKQVKSSPISDGSLEMRVAAFLLKAKGDQSLGIFAAKLGIPKESLSRYLNCEQSMSLSTLQKIATALGIKPTSMLLSRRK